MNIIDKRINGKQDEFLGGIGAALGSLVGKGLDNRRAKKDREANARLSADNLEIERLRLQQEQERTKAAAAQAPRITGVAGSSNTKMYWIGGGVAVVVLIIVAVFAFR